MPITTRPHARHLWACYRGEWEHIDTADANTPKTTMVAEYRMAFGPGWTFRWRTTEG